MFDASHMPKICLVAALAASGLLAGCNSSSTAGTGGGGGAQSEMSIHVTGAGDDVPVTATDVAAQAGSACGGKELVIVTSGAKITCGASVTEAATKPMITLFLSDSAPGTYTAIEDLPGGDGCPEKVFRGNLDAEGISTLDATGSVVITSSDGGVVTGTFDLAWTHDGEAGHGSSTGTFTAPICR